MELSHLLVQILVAIGCATVASILIPKRVPGKFAGLVVIGMAGVWLGEWTYELFRRQYGINYSFLDWQIHEVRLVPTIVGSAIILYVVTTVIKWGRYGT
jgi:uncharacterized membrane protein YeaQ/YmgE (transglycosylase-associated protein family)